MSSNAEGILSRGSSLPSTWIFMTMCFRVCIDGRSMSKKLGTIHGFKTRRGKQSEILMITVKISLTRYVYISKGMTMNATPAKHCLDQEFQNSPLSWAET